jgi:O-acetyl-ADP-ribose deacetylase
VSGSGESLRIGGSSLTVLRGDITEQRVDAIVNAANSGLLGGGGVDGAIHRRGGSVILEACRELRRTTLPDGLPPGGAVATPAGALPARWVIHAVGPVWRGGGAGEPDTLRSAYLESLERARELGAGSIAFPSISTGAYGYPVAAAAEVAVRAVAGWLRDQPGLELEVRWVAFSDRDREVYAEHLRRHADPG